MTKTKYSFKKGFQKALLYSITSLATIVAFSSLNDVSIWSLLEEYLKPVLGSLTVGGAFTMAINYVRFKQSSKK